jgi:hypothetical protein
MTKDVERLTKVLHHISIRELDDDALIDKYFGLLTKITNNLKSVLEYDDNKIKYDRSAWINRGSEEGWWSNPMDYEKDSDLESLSIQIAQMLKWDKIIKER